MTTPAHIIQYLRQMLGREPTRLDIAQFYLDQYDHWVEVFKDAFRDA